MGDIRADLEADLKIAEEDVEASKLIMDKAVADHSRLRDARAAIKVQLLKLDLYIGSKWQVTGVDRYYGSRRTKRVTVVFVDETHVITLDGTVPERIAINAFTKMAKKIPDA